MKHTKTIIFLAILSLVTARVVALPATVHADNEGIEKSEGIHDSEGAEKKVTRHISKKKVRHTKAKTKKARVTKTKTTSSIVQPTPVPAASTYTISQVAAHNSASSCYTVINSSVYDVTTWISQHPGGRQAILSLCGKDGSAAFNGQHGGQARPASELASFKIGTLK